MSPLVAVTISLVSVVAAFIWGVSIGFNKGWGWCKEHSYAHIRATERQYDSQSEGELAFAMGQLLESLWRHYAVVEREGDYTGAKRKERIDEATT